MVYPHISLNLQNPQIHGAIFGFSEDFYCEIHEFHGQSSGTAVDLSKSSSRSEGVHPLLSGCQCDGWTVIAFYTISVCLTNILRFADGVQSKAGLSDCNTDLNTDLSVSDLISLISDLFIYLIMKSSCLG